MLRYLQTLLDTLKSDPAAPDGGAYPYPTLLPLLQVLATPAEYQRVIPAKRLWRSGSISPSASYWSVIPTYTYAECPFCGRRYQESADTYTLLGWAISAFSATLYTGRLYYPTRTWCPHFVGIHAFMNFHQTVPYELEYFQNNWGEVPYLTPWFVPTDLVSYAVLHALPICRIEGDQFVPRYTVFILTYFSKDGRDVLGRHYAKEWDRGAHDPEFYPSTVIRPGYDKGNLYNLPYWATSGRLGWLDVTDPTLPLRIGSNLAWPHMYDQIPGRRRAFNWRHTK